MASCASASAYSNLLYDVLARASASSLIRETLARRRNDSKRYSDAMPRGMCWDSKACSFLEAFHDKRDTYNCSIDCACARASALYHK